MSKSNLRLNFPKGLQVALVGNPNSGKSTLFNNLTGSNQQIGNWPGVTVEQKHGKYIDAETRAQVKIVDLPGCYSLVATADMALDELVTCNYILTAQDTLFVNVIDATHLSRDLYLTLQLLELGVPVIVALNCIDLAKAAAIKIDCNLLAQHLGCPVVPIIAKTGKNLVQLKQQITISAAIKTNSNFYKIEFPPLLNTTLNFWRAQVNAGQGLRILEGDVLLLPKLTAAGIDGQQVRQQIEQQIAEPLDIFIAKHRRSLVRNIIHATVTQRAQKNSNISKTIDSIVLHKIFGPLIFIGIMYLMFALAINLGGRLQLVFDNISETFFVTKFTAYLIDLGAANWLVDILANGLGKGLNITITFVPVLAAMFLCLGILESSGYMMRAAFLVDRLMRFLGLPGKAFVPMIVGFGCNVPAIMGARTLSSRRERILTIMMTPFMSCSARLAIYAIFVAAFFPTNGQNIIFSLYLIGILVAILTGFALRANGIASERAFSIMEMPDYRWPLASNLLRQVKHRLKSFVVKAGGLIILLCIVINGLGYENVELIGKYFTPVFAPIGISADNWPATVGLVTGLIAKEAVIGTLNSVYSQSATDMVTLFGGQAAAYAYLLFTLLYFPCASVVAVIAKELNKKWALFAVIWSTSIAYITAALFYQLATWHGVVSLFWVSGLLMAATGLFMGARWLVRSGDKHTVSYKPVPTALKVV
jgi:ferrous iron transport protein B